MHMLNWNPSNYSMARPFKFLSISHTDTDGFSCTILAKFLEKCVPHMVGTYVNTSPSRLVRELDAWKERFDEFDYIWVTDMTITQATVDKVNELGIGDKLLILDHHACELETIPEWALIAKYVKDNPLDHRNNAIYYKSGVADDQQTCATAIFYYYLLNSPFRAHLAKCTIDAAVLLTNASLNIAAYVATVEAYDTFSFWQYQMEGILHDNHTLTAAGKLQGEIFALQNAPRVNALYHCIDHAVYEDYILNYISQNLPYAFLTEGASIDVYLNNPVATKYSWIKAVVDLEMSRNAQYIDAALKRLTVSPFKRTIFKESKLINLDYTCAIVFAEKNGPSIGNTACWKMPYIDFCAIVANNQVSLYTTKEDIRVCDIVAAFGGVGHNSAATFTISYQSANIFNINHFFNIADSAGRCAHSVDDSAE